MFCAKCGANIPDHVKFCPNCGTATTATVIPTGPANSVILKPASSLETPSTPVYSVPPVAPSCEPTAPVAPPSYDAVPPMAPSYDAAPPVAPSYDVAPPVAPAYEPLTFSAYTPAAERKKAFNIAAIVILGLCLIMWFCAPFLHLDLYWGEDISRTSAQLFGDMTEELDDLGDWLEHHPIYLVPFSSFIFISLGMVFTFLKKMTVVRIMGIVNSAFTATMLLIEASGEYSLLEYLHVGFYCIFIGMFVLIFLAGDRYSD